MKTHVVKTGPEATLAEAIDLIDLYQAGGLPVVDAEGRLCGMLTEADVWRALMSANSLHEIVPDENACAVQKTSSATIGASEIVTSGTAAASFPDPLRERACAVARWRVGDWMTAPAIYVLEHSGVGDAAQTLITRRLKRLPVVTDDGQVVGMLNRVDVMQALVEGLL